MKPSLTGIAACAALLLSTAAEADTSVNGTSWDSKDRFMVRLRAIGVVPDEDSSLNIGGRVEADDAVVPEVDITYFFTDNLAAELIAATSPHDMSAKNTAIGNVDLGDAWVLPPTLTAQYHFIPHGQYRPYVGAGLGYLFYYNEDRGSVNDIDYDNGIAYALQAGMDIGIDERWAVNLDVKKLFHNTDVSINSGAVRADVDLDPWVIGVGLAYRF